jgi:hypothetical protein
MKMHRSSLGSKRKTALRIAFCALAFAAAAGPLAACVAGGEQELAPIDGIDNDPGNDPQSGPCTDGETRACHVTLGEYKGVVSCFVGTKTCTGGVFGPCTDGEVTDMPAPNPPPPPSWEDGGVPMASLSTASQCVDNPCDPSCKNFDEQPDGGVKPDGGTPTVNWKGGDIGDMPNGLVKKGLKEPCSSASDCQFDTYCKNPASGTCEHSQCVTGKALTDGCNPCVTAICEDDPTCCEFAYSGTCAHDPCATGGRLKSTCDPCVAAICAQNPSCCSIFGSWSQTCADMVDSVCGKSCEPPSWGASCVAKVHDVCGAFCETEPPCAHDPCTEGGALASSCDPCVAAVCAADPQCCSGEWDETCVFQVGSVCNQTCPGKGECVPWLPTEKDPSCSGVDLTVGVPCQDSVPVCNHGNTTAPAGVKLVHFPANSQQFPSCSPDQSHPQAKTCFTDKPIPPGKCIDVTTCTGLNGNREIMVNPSGAQHIAECFCENNWSISNDGSCSVPSCSGASSEAQITKVNMFVSVDKSGSMNDATRWAPAMAALKAFFQDTKSAGLGVALRFWPDNIPSDCSSPSCNVTNCSQPAVALGTLTAASAPTDTQESLLVASINAHSPGGVTPMSAALGGATQWAKNYQTANPNEKTVVVFITDGEPNGCDENTNNIAALAGDAFTTSGVQTFVIGIAGVQQSTIDKIATEGGGKSFFIQPNTDTKTQLLAAMQEIRGTSASCSFDLPNAGLFDPNQASVLYTPSSGSAVTFGKVQDAASCGNGWYYDSNLNPTKVTLCPTQCAQVQADTGAKIEVKLGCPSAYQPATYTQQYEATCPSGKAVHWGYFAYDTITPSTSNVAFKVRTGDTLTSFGATKTLATATLSPNTQVCAMGGPAPCPKNIGSILGLPDASKRYLELIVNLNPSDDATLVPTVNDWQITYSCVDAE